jgi:glycosyltransferase involved in cell wall biosynthesis
MSTSSNTRLLICAQAIDARDPTMSFFLHWVVELAARFESIEIIALGVGEYTLPENVHIHSLGKERGRASSLVYARRLLVLAYRLRCSYDRVFVHQGEEFALAGGPLWKLLGKRIYMWRNHYAGSLRTRIAGAFCANVFYTSRASYTARFRNALRMPVGVELDAFAPAPRTALPASILSLGRISPTKNVHVLMDALALLSKKTSFTADIYGDSLPVDSSYHARLKEDAAAHGLSGRVAFHAGVPHAETSAIFRAHQLFVNMSDSGMYDKTIFEAAASGCLVLTSIQDFADDAGSEFCFDGSAEDLAGKLEGMLSLAPTEADSLRARLREVAEAHNLTSLAERLTQAIH